jgi:hypothetical protein
MIGGNPTARQGRRGLAMDDGLAMFLSESVTTNTPPPLLRLSLTFTTSQHRRAVMLVSGRRGHSLHSSVTYGGSFLHTLYACIGIDRLKNVQTMVGESWPCASRRIHLLFPRDLDLRILDHGMAGDFSYWTGHLILPSAISEEATTAGGGGLQSRHSKRG